ncbi:hypothetical protein [Martelella sp. AMO21009]
MPGGRPSKYDPAFCERVVELGAEGASLTEMAADIGVVRDTIYSWADTHAEFFDALKRASELSQSYWERLGREGTTGKISGFNALSYIFQMKNRFPRDWRDRKEIENNHIGLPSHNQIDSVTFQVVDAQPLNLSNLSDEQLKQLETLYNQSQTKVINHDDDNT